MKKRIKILKQQILESKLVRTTFAWSKRLKLPGFGGLSLYGLINVFVESFKKNSYSMRSAAISFKFFLALFPGILFFFSLIPFVPIDNFQENLLLQIDLVTPDNIYAVIEQTINDLVTEKHHFVLGIGIFLTLFYASNGINMMLTVFNSSHQIAMKRSPIKQRLISLAIFAAMSILMIISLSALTIGEVMINNIEYKNLGIAARFLFQLAKWSIMIISLMFAMATLFNLGNPDSKSTRWRTAGTSFATVGILIVSYAISYFFINFGSYNELYGSIGTLMMILIWLNAVCYVMLIGFELHTLSEKQLEKWDDESVGELSKVVDEISNHYRKP